MKLQKCSAHCPGKVILPNSNSAHECCQPKYVTGNLKISSLRKPVPRYPTIQRRVKETANKDYPEDHMSCYDQFALAKKLHAENLQHQPLPDKVHDSVFENVRARSFPASPQRRNVERGRCFCSRNDGQCGPALGCKKPETKMDLAICWETPIDPVYEPHKPTHIDGSEGGAAPAIFALVEHSHGSTRACVRSGNLRKDDGNGNGECEREVKNTEEIGTVNGNCCKCLCKDLDSISISKRERDRKSSSSRPRRSARNCYACDNPRRDDPRLIKSAVGATLGMENGDTNLCKNRPRLDVPRPRTPFARRSFRIDTLAPPFSVVNGRRDSDYPEHWRLMSVYQQSYRNPQKRNAYRR